MGNRFVVVMLFVLGGVFLIAGVGVGHFAAQSSRAAAERAERLAPRNVAQLARATPGDTLLVEGRVSERNPAQFRDFVAYVREEYRGDDEDGDAQWVQDEAVTPPLILELTDDSVLLDGGYSIEAPRTVWQETQTLRWNGFSGEGTKRYRGVRAGDTLMVIGVVARGAEMPQLRPEVVYGGTRDQYIAAQQSAAAFLPWLGAIFAIVGIVLGGIGVRMAVR